MTISYFERYSAGASLAVRPTQAGFDQQLGESGLIGQAGVAEVDFGAFPGSSFASVDITGLDAIGAGDVVAAWLYPRATADHSADEHILEPVHVVAGNISGAVGFTIYAVPRVTSAPDNVMRKALTDTFTPYGAWSVAWRWVPVV